MKTALHIFRPGTMHWPQVTQVGTYLSLTLILGLNLFSIYVFKSLTDVRQ